MIVCGWLTFLNNVYVHFCWGVVNVRKYFFAVWKTGSEMPTVKNLCLTSDFHLCFYLETIWSVHIIWCHFDYQIPVTYAGGVTEMADLERIRTAGMERVNVTVGSALDIFGGNLAYEDVVAWHAQQNASVV